MFQNALYQTSYAVGFCWGIRVSYEHSFIFNISIIHTVCKTTVTFLHTDIVSSSKSLKIQQLKPENPLASGSFDLWSQDPHQGSALDPLGGLRCPLDPPAVVEYTTKHTLDRYGEERQGKFLDF
jgi:hypothetical protein